MKFDIRDYPGKYVMHCKTKEEAKDFCQHLHDLGLKWSTGTSYACCDSWEDHRTGTAYSFNTGQYANTDYFRGLHYTILEWEDFMKHTFTKADLKNGDIVKFENNEFGCVIKEHNMIITRFCWIDLENYRDDMSSRVSSQYNIKAVRRPRGGFECRFDAFEENRGELVYDRERDTVVEMTMEEICAALGKPIKIVKEKRS